MPRALLAATLAAILLAVPAAAADWPQFLGPGRDGVYPGALSWPQGGPRQLWRIESGAGFSGPAVADGRVYLFERKGNDEVLRALATANGAEQWSLAYPTAYHDDFGFDPGPRATPVISGGKVVTFGAQGVLQVADATTGKLVWRRKLNEDFAVPKGFFGAAGTPLVHDGHIFLNIGGPQAGIVSLALATGETLWTALGHEASYASPVAADIAGKETIVFFTREGLVGAVPDTGEILFSKTWRSRSRSSVNAATPIVAGNRIFVSAAYGTGALLAEVDGSELREVWSGEDSLTNHYATAVHQGEYLFGYHGRQEYGQELRCVEFATGKVLWTKEGFGAGSIVLAGDKLVLVTESGDLVLAEASPKAYRELGRKKILDPTVRAFPALADGVLYARNGNTLIAVEIASKP